MRTSYRGQEKCVREADEWKTLLSCLLRLTAVTSVRTKFAAILQKKEEQGGSKVLQRKQCEYLPKKRKTFHRLYFPTAF